MISCSILGHKDYGRFGNQIFQYSLAKVLSTLHNCNFYVDPNKKFLQYFNTKVMSYKKLDRSTTLRKYIEKDPFAFDSQLLKQNNIDIIGFFQNLKYYQDFLKEIRLELQPNNRILSETNSYIKNHSNIYDLEKTVCIHIRRTDYTALRSKHGFLDVNYYTNIIKTLDYLNIFIISDDIKQVKQEFANHTLSNKIIFVDDLDVYHDFYIMYLSGINILANSTFSWWAALLSDKNQHKNVFIPDQWIHNKSAANTKCDTIDLYPSHWKRVSQTINEWSVLFK